ncbi:MAG: TonB-dependent receptor, partial [Longimicrobiales bacterium]
MVTPLVLALSAFTAFQQPAGATVSGQVRSESGGALPYARVEVIVNSRPSIAAQTDINGVYVLHDVPLGRQVIRARHIDHAPLEIEIVLFGPVYPRLDFTLDIRPVAIPFVTGNATRSRLPDTLAASNSELSAAAARAMEATPGVAELGLAEAAREVPGRDPVDPADVLWVRGGTADLKLVLLNGAPVYAPFHIGGLIHALDADVLRSATLYLGGAPSKYDGGLSYVLDMETRGGRTTRPHARLAVDMLAAEGSVEGPIGPRVAFLASGRTVHGLGTGPFFQGAFPYGYGDALARVDGAIGQTSGISAMGFWNRERIRIDSGAVVNDAEWGNSAGSLRYIGTHRNTNLLLTVGGGHFQTELPLGGLQPLLTIGIADRVRYAADIDRAVGPVRAYFGLSHDRLAFEYQAVSQIGGGDSVLVRSRAEGNVTGAYAEGAITALKRVRLRGGLRADVFSLSPGVRIAPRVSGTMLLSDRAALT